MLAECKVMIFLRINGISCHGDFLLRVMEEVYLRKTTGEKNITKEVSKIVF